MRAKVLSFRDLDEADSLVQELESCTRKSKLMVKELWEGLTVQPFEYAGDMLMHPRNDAATKGEIAYDELIKAAGLVEKLTQWFDAILTDEAKARSS